MECSRCLLTSDITNIENGYCDFCRLHDELEKNSELDFMKILTNLFVRGEKVLIGISGGLDSSYLLWYTVKILGLPVLALHFDNGWNTPTAEFNMRLLVEKLGVDLVRVRKDVYYDRLCGALLAAGVKDADIANDMYMADIMQTTAKRYGIKYVFNGHNFREEGSTPLDWTYMDAKYIQSVYEWAYGEKLRTKHLQTFWKQIKSGVKQIRVFHYMNIPFIDRYNTMIDFGLRDYGPKHSENIYTKFIGYDLLPNKWGIDKRIIYLSAQIRSGVLTKEEAMEELKEGVYFNKSYYSEIEKRTGVKIEAAMNAPKRTYKDFDHYNFKRFKPLILLMTKLRLVPYTFYKKYTSG